MRFGQLALYFADGLVLGLLDRKSGRCTVAPSSDATVRAAPASDAAAYLRCGQLASHRAAPQRPCLDWRFPTPLCALLIGGCRVLGSTAAAHKQASACACGPGGPARQRGDAAPDRAGARPLPAAAPAGGRRHRRLDAQGEYVRPPPPTLLPFAQTPPRMPLTHAVSQNVSQLADAAEAAKAWVAKPDAHRIARRVTAVRS
jgi:hypothetical protein